MIDDSSDKRKAHCGSSIRGWQQDTATIAGKDGALRSPRRPSSLAVLRKVDVQRRKEDYEFGWQTRSVRCHADEDAAARRPYLGSIIKFHPERWFSSFCDWRPRCRVPSAGPSPVRVMDFALPLPRHFLPSHPCNLPNPSVVFPPPHFSWC